MGFNLGDMWKRIGLGAPALSSFLTGICGGSKMGRCETDDRMDVDQMGDCEGAEDEMERDDDDVEDSEPQPGQRVNPARLLEIVCSLGCCIFSTYAIDREK